MGTIVDYKILTSPSAITLAANVKSEFTTGWQPFGGASFEPLTNEYMQAIVLYASK